MSLRLRPWLEVHRKLKKIRGAMWCVSIREGTEVVGVALVGWPSQEQTTDEIDHLRVLRCTVKEGHKNGCSMLYGACWRAVRAMGVTSGVALPPGGDEALPRSRAARAGRP